MNAPSPGIPILSGPPPLVESTSCRQCARDFNPLWRRGKACGHCGYEYCSSCLDDGHALMPRREQRERNPGALTELRDALLGHTQTPGYDVEPVCAQCLGMLQVTAAPLTTLRTLPLKRLKEYLAAYDIKAVALTEKEDVVQAVFRARDPATGCLQPEYEATYRRKSVPRGGAQPPPRTNYAPRTRPPRPPPPRPNPNTHNSHAFRPPPPHYANPSRPQRPPPPQQRPPPPRQQPRPPPQPAARSPPPPVPTILSLVALPKSYLSSLSIGTLKAILFDNHVRVDFKQVLEKNDLINRVGELVNAERKRLERQRVAEDREAAEAEAARRAREATVAMPEAEASAVEAAAPTDDAAPAATTTPPETKPGPTGPAPEIDRGLCVVCQDEEATLAVVDCGHLAMCQHCSDLIMATSRECPLCRTKILTAHRLIRIYRT